MPARTGQSLSRSLQALGIHRDGDLADYVLVPHRQAVALPPSVSALHGAFCEPLACCLHGIDGAGIVAGASVVVLGGGVIGLLVVQLARLAGATTVVLATRQAVRRRLAESIGATATVDPGAGDVVGAIVGPHGLVPGGADVVIECAGVAETVQQSLRVARRGATVVILGVMPQGETVAIEPFDLLVRELRVQGSFINPFVHQRAAALIGAGSIILDPLITRTVPLDGVVAVVTHPPSPGEVKVMAVPPG